MKKLLDKKKMAEGNSRLKGDIRGYKTISDIEIRFDDEKEYKRMSAFVRRELKKPAYKGLKSKDVYFNPDALQIGFGDPSWKLDVNLKPIVDLVVKNTKDPQTRVKSLAGEETVTGPSIAGTGDDSSTVVVRKKKKKTIYGILRRARQK